MTKPRLFFLFDQNSQKQLVSYLRSNPTDVPNIKVIIHNQSVGEILKSRYSTNYRCLDDYLTNAEVEQLTKETILWFHEWCNLEMEGRKSFTEYFKIHDCSLWWISGYLYLIRDIIFIFTLINKICRVLDEEKFDSIIIPKVSKYQPLTTQLPLSDYITPYKLLDMICKQRSLKCEFVDFDRQFYLKWRFKVLKNRIESKLFDKIFLSFTAYCRFWISRTKGSQSFLKSYLKNRKRKLLLVSPSINLSQILNLDNGQKIWGDQKLGYFYQKLNKLSDITTIGIDSNTITAVDFNNIKMKIKNDPFLNWYALENFLSLQTLRRSRRMKRDVSKTCKFLLAGDFFQKTLKYKGVHFFPLLQSRIKFVLKSLFPDGINKVLLYERLLEKYQPDLLIISYEAGLHGRAAICAARNFKVPVVAVQHGRIFPSHPHYLHLNINKRHQPDYKYAPIADITCLFGDFFKTILTKDSVYPPDSVAVTGQIQTDCLDIAISQYDRIQVLKDLGLNNEQPVISLMSQNIDPESDYEKLFQIPCEAMNHFPDFNFIVKLHPYEMFTKVNALVQKFSKFPEKVKIIKSVELYEVIFASDIIITGNSTVGLEAMIFKKPLITIEGFKFSMGYAESGSSIGVKSRAELHTAINEILSDSSRQEQLISCGQEYLRHHLYKIDGNVSERILALGNQLISKGS